MAENRRPVSDPVELQNLDDDDHDPQGAMHASLPADMSRPDEAMDGHWFNVIRQSCLNYHNFEVKADFLRFKYNSETQTMYPRIWDIIRAHKKGVAVPGLKPVLHPEEEAELGPDEAVGHW